MIPHERANSFLSIVYRTGLVRAKSVLSEQAKAGDRISRMLLNAVGLHEQHANLREARGSQSETFSPRQMAGQIRFALEMREKALLVNLLINQLVESDLSVGSAIETLL